ncbi:MAG TPA: holo-[acyl-carrier-protein] synthase [Planctomycetes bacterium]|nr:holo-[acyl-carrier-protein] synthase [Planctomycetota bacterium]
MIAGIGLDVLEVDRVRNILERWGDRFLKRVLTANEIEYCRRHTDIAPYVAVRVAAKEAFFKATGLGLSDGMAWRQVIVEREERGKPCIALSGRAAEVIREMRVDAMQVTLSHAHNVAAAVVILERCG